MGAIGFYFLGSILKKEELFIAGKWSLFFGTLGAGVSVWTGLQAAETVYHDEEIHQMMMAHQYVGIALLVLSAALSLWVIISKKTIPSARLLFLGGLLILSALIAQAADLGGLSKRTFAELLGKYGVSIFNYPASDIERDLKNV